MEKFTLQSTIRSVLIFILARDPQREIENEAVIPREHVGTADSGCPLSAARLKFLTCKRKRHPHEDGVSNLRLALASRLNPHPVERPVNERKRDQEEHQRKHPGKRRIVH